MNFQRRRIKGQRRSLTRRFCLDKAIFLLDLKIDYFYVGASFPGFPDIFCWPCRGRLAARSRHITCCVERFCRRVMPSLGLLGLFMTKIVFIGLVPNILKSSISVDSFNSIGFFHSFFRFSFPIRVVKSKNEICSGRESTEHGVRSCDGIVSKNCLWRRFFPCIENHTSNMFARGRFRKILVEKKIRDMVTRFGQQFLFRWMDLAKVLSMWS